MASPVQRWPTLLIWRIGCGTCASPVGSPCHEVLWSPCVVIYDINAYYGSLAVAFPRALLLLAEYRSPASSPVSVWASIARLYACSVLHAVRRLLMLLLPLLLLLLYVTAVCSGCRPSERARCLLCVPVCVLCLLWKCAFVHACSAGRLLLHLKIVCILRRPSFSYTPLSYHTLCFFYLELQTANFGRLRLPHAARYNFMAHRHSGARPHRRVDNCSEGVRLAIKLVTLRFKRSSCIFGCCCCLPVPRLRAMPNIQAPNATTTHATDAIVIQRIAVLCISKPTQPFQFRSFMIFVCACSVFAEMHFSFSTKLARINSKHTSHSANRNGCGPGNNIWRNEDSAICSCMVAVRCSLLAFALRRPRRAGKIIFS